VGESKLPLPVPQSLSTIKQENHPGSSSTALKLFGESKDTKKISSELECSNISLFLPGNT